MNANSAKDKQKQPMTHIIAEVIFTSAIVVGVFYALGWVDRTLVPLLLRWIPNGTFEANEVNLMDILLKYVYQPAAWVSSVLFLLIFALTLIGVAGAYIAQGIRSRRTRRTNKE